MSQDIDMQKELAVRAGDSVQWGERVGTVTGAYFDDSLGKWLITAVDEAGGWAAWEDEISDYAVASVTTAAASKPCKMCGAKYSGTKCPRCGYDENLRKPFFGQGSTDRKNTLRRCFSCEGFFLSAMAIFRCPACVPILRQANTVGALIVLGAMSQRELAELKREFHEVETLMADLDARKAEFLRRATEQADALVEQVEAAVGRPVKELRAKRELLRQKMKDFMTESGEAKLRVRDLLLEVTEDVVNRGGVPQPTVVYEKLREIAGITQEELQVIVRSSYSEPKTAPVLHINKLPPGRVQKEREKQRGGSVCLKSGDGIYVLSGALVEKHGVDTMIERQRVCKGTLSVTSRRGDFLLISGRFASDPNSVRAFVADRFPTHQITDAQVVGTSEVAISLKKAADMDLGSIMGYFTLLIDLADDLTALESEKAAIAADAITAATTTGEPIRREQLPNSSRTPGNGDSPQEGIMQPEGGAPILTTGV